MKIQENETKTRKNTSYSWMSIFILVTSTAFFYVFMEWLFIVTKPSFMISVSVSEKIAILLFSASSLSTLCTLAISPFIVFDFFLSCRRVWYVRKFIILLPGIALASSFLLLFDNFSYTVFGFGIVSSQGMIRALYAVSFLALFFFVARKLFTITKALDQKYQSLSIVLKRAVSIILLVVNVSPAVFLLFSHFSSGNTIADPTIAAENNEWPNIILITGDGIDADHLSVYGYERETTPFLEEMAQSSLVAVNAFSNSGMTTGSITSILTGKYPADTRVLSSPDILRGEDAFQHLPGILKSLGYRTAQYTFAYYADAYKINFLSAFDEANGRSQAINPFVQKINKYLPMNHAYFMYEISNRLFDRLRHIFFIKTMENSYEQVTEGSVDFRDDEKLESAIALLEQSDEPLFIEIHWMGTHGATFLPQNRTFSAGQDASTQGVYNTDFYDDSILDFDNGLSYFYQELEERGLIDDTMIVIGSDHGQRNITYERLPLLIRFPNAEHAATITDNVQNLDIAPTILNYLDIPVPDWMNGQSLISGQIEGRSIIGVRAVNVQNEDSKIRLKALKPPFYQFGEISLISCNQRYTIDLDKIRLYSEVLEVSVSDCHGEILTEGEAFTLMINHLDDYGFDTSSLNGIDPN